MAIYHAKSKTVIALYIIEAHLFKKKKSSNYQCIGLYQVFSLFTGVSLIAALAW